MTTVTVLVSIILGFILGAIREIMVVKYQGAIIDLNPKIGAGTTWGIGHLDLLVLYMLAQFNNPWMAVGYIYGESVASYFAIKRRKKKKT